MDVWMAASSQGNPYMDLLIDHVECEGAHVDEGIEPQGTIARRALRDGAPDVLHLHWLNVFFLRGDEWAETWQVARRTAGFLGLLRLLQAAGTTLVWTAHNLHNHERRHLWADTACHRGTARLADAVIAHSPRARHRVVETFELDDPDKVHVVPHGHYVGAYPDAVGSEEARRELSIGDGERVLLFFGRIRPYKNVPSLVRAYRRAAGTGRKTRLIVAGNPSSDELASEIRTAARGRGDVDLHLEFIEDERIQYYMRAADAVVLPYRDILTSGSAVLAMSFRRPVIAPHLGTLRDVLDEEGGVPYDPDRPGGLTEALEAALSADGAALEAMGRHNLDRAREWDWASVAERTMAAYGA